MEGMGNILYTLGTLLHYALTIYLYIIIIGAFISWVNPDPYNPIVRFLRKSTEPLFFWLRRNMPLIVYGIDFSPIIAITLVLFADFTFVPMIQEQGNFIPNILIGTGMTLVSFLSSYMFIVIIAAIISWVSPSPYNPIVRILSAFTEPVFSWFRRRLPLMAGGFDLSPIVVIVLINVINYLVKSYIIHFGQILKLKGGL
jgi:YggT family protein